MFFFLSSPAENVYVPVDLCTCIPYISTVIFVCLDLDIVTQAGWMPVNLNMICYAVQLVQDEASKASPFSSGVHEKTEPESRCNLVDRYNI